MNKGPIFILGCHKSGTSLLRALLDGVDGYFTIPIETHPFQMLNYWIKYPYRRQLSKSIDKELFIKNTVNWVKKTNSNSDKYSDGLTKNWFDLLRFENYLREELGSNIMHGDYIEKYFESIFISLNNNNLNLIEDIGYIEKSVENFEFAAELSSIFKNSRFVHIVRNPYSNLVSLRRYRSRKSRYPIIFNIIKSLQYSFYYSEKNKRTIQNYKIVKYEDLITNPEFWMKDLCKFLKLKFNDKMTTPTVFSKLWKGNSTTNKTFKKVSDIQKNNYLSEINNFEIAMINKFLPHVFNNFQYDKIEASNSPYYKCPNEGTITYLKNRYIMNNGERLLI